MDIDTDNPPTYSTAMTQLSLEYLESILST